jgi:hypothetical protein
MEARQMLIGQKSKVFLIFFVLLIDGCTNKQEYNLQSKSSDVFMGKTSKYFYLKDSEGKEYKIEKLSGAEFDKLIEENGKKVSSELNNSFSILAYELKDNRIIIEQSDNYALYPSKEAAFRILRNFSGPKSVEILEGLNPYNEKFIQLTDSIVHEVYEKYNIRPGNEDVEILDRIVANKRLKDKNNLKGDIIYFIAFVGEKIRKSHNAEWAIKKSELDNRTWTPYLQYLNKPIFFDDLLYTSLDDLNNKSPLKTTYTYIEDAIVNIKASKHYQ